MSVSIPPAFEFDIEDFQNHPYHPVLSNFLACYIQEFHVEFLQQGGRKPHVVLRLGISGSIGATNRHGQQVQLEGCLISVEYIGGDEDAGGFRIKLVNYRESSHAAGAGFRFPLLRQDLQVFDLICILQGTHPQVPQAHKSDLTAINFVVAHFSTGSVDGCRDVVAQWMIRLHAMGKIGWVAVDQSVPGIVFDREPHSLSFEQLIGKNYKPTSYFDPYQRRIVEVSRLPLDRGVFLDYRVRRIETYGQVQLPYNPQH